MINKTVMNIDQIFQELNIQGELVPVDLGTVVFSQGQYGDGLYVVKSGRLRVLKEWEFASYLVRNLKPGGPVWLCYYFYFFILIKNNGLYV